LNEGDNFYALHLRLSGEAKQHITTHPPKKNLLPKLAPKREIKAATQTKSQTRIIGTAAQSIPHMNVQSLVTEKSKNTFRSMVHSSRFDPLLQHSWLDFGRSKRRQEAATFSKAKRFDVVQRRRGALARPQELSLALSPAFSANCSQEDVLSSSSSHTSCTTKANHSEVEVEFDLARRSAAPPSSTDTPPSSLIPVVSTSPNVRIAKVIFFPSRVHNNHILKANDVAANKDNCHPDNTASFFLDFHIALPFLQTPLLGIPS
jgi:hypothetical protein